MSVKEMDMSNIQHGDRVLVYDSSCFIDDVSTPVEMLMKPATVVTRYGTKVDYGSGPVRYPDLVDVVFDCRPDRISRGYFTKSVILIEDH